ncbi:glutamate-rich protein 3 isoform X3 [Zonotrichia albicollis]|uniref:glutamate-rich protein 3 isoform X3 n=1 Tax=Zonotrichia albicollis TaxID=44394 RepID=UPI003D81066C
MSAPQPRILETYNSLTDKHLVGYFSNARIRRHLQKSGLISRSGRIIPEKEYRLNAIRRDHQRHVQGCLADAIYHKVLDIEHHHQLGINRRLDCSARKETMESAKIERLMGQVSPMYAPHPPVAPRNHHALCPLVSGERTGRSLRRGPRLRFDYGDGRYYFRAKEPPVSKRQSSELKFRNPMDYMSGASPYRPSKRRRRRAAPVPPPRPHVGDRCIPGIRRGLPVERWFHSTTGFNEQFLINNTNGFPKSPLCSNALVTMIYLGKSKHVSLRDHKDEIKVYQQYCGTENICVYKGDLLEGDTFQFISKRYLGYPFSLTFFLNGLQVDRLSSCCEYRGFQTKRPCRLQRRNTYFRVLHVAGAPPCYRCFLAMGLDKKLYPPKKKLKFYSRAHMCSCSPYCAHSQPCDSNVLPKSIEDSVSLTIASQEDSVDTIDETLDSEQECCEEEEEEEEGEEIEGEIGEEVEEEAQTEDRSFVETEGTAQETTTQETTSESEYDEDFEDVEVNEEGQIGDQMNGMSKSSSNDKNRNIDYGKESETSSQKALQASDSEKDKRYSDDRDCEDDLPVFEDCKPVQEETAKATGNDHPVNSDPEPGDLCANEEEKNAANTEHSASGAADGRLLAEGRRSLDVQEAAARAGEATGPGQALEQDGAAGGDAGSGEAAGKAAGAGDALPQAGTGAALGESAPEEGTVAQERPPGKGTGPAVELGTEGSPGEQQVLAGGMDREVALGKAAAGTERPAGALPGGEAHRAVPQGQEGAGGTAEEEAADEGRKGAGGPPAEEEVGEPVSEAGEPLGQGGSAGKDTTVAAVSEGEDAGEDADVAATHGNARAVGPEGEKAVEEDFSEGEEALGKPGALWEAPGDMETGEAMSGGEGFVKPSQFSQLKVSEEEWMEMGKAVPGAAAALESAQALQRVEDTREESVEADKGPALEVAPGLGALGGARGDPVTEGSSQVEETLAVQEEEGAAEALWSGNPSEGSEAETERAVEGKPEGEAVGGSAGAAGAGSEDEEEATDGAAGSEEPAAGTEGWLRCGQAGGQGRCPGEGAAAGPCGSRAGEPGLVAIAVLGGQAGPGALPGAGGLGTGAMAQAGVTGAAPGAQSGAGAQPVSAAGGEPGGAGEGPAGAPAAAGPEGKREAAAGGEARAAGPAGARRPEPGTEPLGHAGGLGAGALGEQAAAETAPSSPGHGGVAARARGAGGEGLCPGTPPQPAATGTARGRHGRQEPGMERDAGQAGDEQPSAPENTREGEVAAVSASAGPAEQRKDGPVGGSPSVPAAADGGDRSCSSRQDSANPDPLIMSSEEDGEETLL